MEQLMIQSFWQTLLLLYPAWRIYGRAGLNPALSVTVVIPVLGVIICPLILVFSRWQIQSAGGE